MKRNIHSQFWSIFELNILLSAVYYIHLYQLPSLTSVTQLCFCNTKRKSLHFQILLLFFYFIFFLFPAKSILEETNFLISHPNQQREKKVLQEVLCLVNSCILNSTRKMENV